MSTLTHTPAAPPAVERPPLDPAPRRLVAYALVTGLFLEVGLRGGVANAVVVTAVALVGGVLFADGRVRQPEARITVALALVPGVFLAVRASPWLAWSNALAVLTLLFLGVVHAHHGALTDSRPAQLLGRGLSGLARGAAALGIVRLLGPRMSTDQRNDLARVSRGFLVAAPVLLVLVGLLASADAVFASFLTPDLRVGPITGHVALALLLAPLVVMLVGAASAEPGRSARPGTFGAIEVTTMLGLVAAVLALFVLSQLVAMTGAGDRLIESAGLTPAEYARSGFFQLCWATGLLLGFLAVVRAVADPVALRHPLVVALGAVVPLLALGLVVVSLRRMALYDDAFGLTMLRLWVVGAALWMGAVLIMTALRNLATERSREWLTAGSGVVALALLAVANLIDPEALVARHNIDRARAGAELDVDYLSTLSDDVVPAIVDAIDAETDPVRLEALRGALRCADERIGVASLNLAVRRASDARDERCRTDNSGEEVPPPS